MTDTYRVVGWRTEKTGPRLARAIREFHPTKTPSGTHRKLGQIVLHMLEHQTIDWVTVNKVGSK